MHKISNKIKQNILTLTWHYYFLCAIYNIFIKWSLLQLLKPKKTQICILYKEEILYIFFYLYNIIVHGMIVFEIKRSHKLKTGCRVVYEQFHFYKRLMEKLKIILSSLIYHISALLRQKHKKRCVVRWTDGLWFADYAKQEKQWAVFRTSIYTFVIL